MMGNGGKSWSTLNEPRNSSDGWMEVNINLFLLTAMMSFLTNHEHHPEANLETERDNGGEAAEGLMLTRFQSPDSQSC